MANITILKKNESTALVDCDAGIAQELSEYFSFFVPGYKYMKLYKRRIWDGKIRLFNAISRELPAGLYPFVDEFCKRNSYTLLTESSDYGSPLDKNEQDPEVIYKYIKDLNLQSRGNSIDIRDYQFDAVMKALNLNRCVF